MGSMIDLAKLRSILSYEPETGLFRWTSGVRTGNGAMRLPPGAVAGTRTSDGYIQIRIEGVLYRAHRLAWLYVHGEWPNAEIDHANRDGTDNRLCNLREATRSQNIANTKRRSSNISGFKGVSWSKNAGRWVAFIRIGGRSKYLGYFDTPESAHAAYVAAAKCSFGEFARAA